MAPAKLHLQPVDLGDPFHDREVELKLDLRRTHTSPDLRELIEDLIDRVEANRFGPFELRPYDFDTKLADNYVFGHPAGGGFRRCFAFIRVLAITRILRTSAFLPVEMKDGLARFFLKERDDPPPAEPADPARIESFILDRVEPNDARKTESVYTAADLLELLAERRAAVGDLAFLGAYHREHHVFALAHRERGHAYTINTDRCLSADGRTLEQIEIEYIRRRSGSDRLIDPGEILEDIAWLGSQLIDIYGDRLEIAPTRLTKYDWIAEASIPSSER